MKGIYAEGSLLERIVRVLLVERRLPYSWSDRAQEYLYKEPLQKTLKKIARTPATPCRPNAAVELHMVTCERDLYMAIAACKSFLRFGVPVTVVFHGDESINNDHLKLLLNAIPGCRVYTYEDAASIARQSSEVFYLRERIPERFSLGAGYENHKKAWALKVLDFHLMSNANKIIVLDSDTLFLRRPDEIIEWIETDQASAFFSVPFLPNLKVSEKRYKEVFPDASVITRFNGGLFGFDRQNLTLELVQRTVELLLDNPDIPVLGDECIWRFACAQVESNELPYRHYPLTTHPNRSKKIAMNIEDVKYVHFILKHKGGFYKNLADRVCRDLSTS